MSKTRKTTVILKNLKKAYLVKYYKHGYHHFITTSYGFLFLDNTDLAIGCEDET